MRWALFGAYLALTVFLSSQPRIRQVERLPDYALHAVEFTVLTILFLLAASGSVRGPHSLRALLAALGFGAFYGAVDETHQYFIPGRHSSVKDALVDAAATAATVLVVAVVGRRTRGIAGLRPAAPGGTGGTIGPEPSAKERAAQDAPRVEMLTRSGCHLCEEAGGVLTRVLGPRGSAWSVIDISSDPSLERMYGREIPVVLIDGIKRFKGRVDGERLAGLLRDRGRLRRSGSAGS